MAAKLLDKVLRFFQSKLVLSSDEASAEDTSGVCYILDLPPEILQTMTEHLKSSDVFSLSQTCRLFHTLINDDTFWTHRIRCQFSPSIAHRYIFELFQQPQYIQTNDEPRRSGSAHERDNDEIDNLARNSATHYNDEAVKQRHAKMYVSKEEFVKNVQYFQFTQPTNMSAVPFMKLVYFYLIDRKREAAVDMSVIHRNNHYLVEQADPDSFKGRVIRLQHVCWLEITGRFAHDIMPGKYEVIWRMKCQGNDVRMWDNTELMVVPSHGRMLLCQVSDNDFRTYALDHSNRWFLIKMGQIIIYEPSTVMLAVRNWNNGNWKSGISWDCIELKLIS